MSEAERARIVATAERLFREIGFQKTTVADIPRLMVECADLPGPSRAEMVAFCLAALRAGC